jgi:hypothetical protein
MNLIFFSNEIHGQKQSAGDRRWNFFKVSEGEYIEDMCRDYGWTSAQEYFEHYCSIDPHAWIYHLCFQVDISQFKPGRDHNRTYETANQVIMTNATDNPVQDFWYSLISPSNMEKYWQFRIRRESKDILIEILKSYQQQNVKEEIKADAENFLTRLNESTFDINDDLQEQPTQILQGEHEFVTLESSVFHFLSNDKKNKHRVSEFMCLHPQWFFFEDFHKKIFLPIYCPPDVKAWQKIKCDFEIFKKEIVRICGKKEESCLMKKKIGSKRKIHYSFISLYHLRKRYEKIVLKKDGFFEVKLKDWIY